MTLPSSVEVGVTRLFPCGYLPEQQEQLLVITDLRVRNSEDYEALLAAGFRRSHNDLYRPQCPSCKACQSLRVAVEEFRLSRSQRRIINKGQALSVKYSTTLSEDHYALYARYIEQRHRDGSMYPPSVEQYNHLIANQWVSTCYLTAYLQEQCVLVAVMDETPTAYSAVYTFYDPEIKVTSLGTWAILQQLNLAKTRGKHWLYLGYQIDDCPAMNYKNQFKPHQQLVDGVWRKIDR